MIAIDSRGLPHFATEISKGVYGTLCGMVVVADVFGRPGNPGEDEPGCYDCRQHNVKEFRERIEQWEKQKKEAAAG